MTPPTVERHPIPAPHEPQAEHLPWGFLTVVAVAALALFAIGSVWATWILIDQAGQVTNPGVVPAPGKVREVGMVDQSLFDLRDRPELLLDRQRARLGRYGWVDREKGIIHLPIERAMERVVEGER